MRKSIVIFVLALLVGGPPGLGAAQVNEVIIAAPCFGVELSGVCIRDPSPAQRAEAEAQLRANRDRADRDRAERLRLARAREASIQAEVDRLGEHRRQEAISFVEAREKAAQARPQQRDCTPRPVTGSVNSDSGGPFSGLGYSDVSIARRQTQGNADERCGALGGASLSDLTCRAVGGGKHVCTANYRCRRLQPPSRCARSAQ